MTKKLLRYISCIVLLQISATHFLAQSKTNQLISIIPYPNTLTLGIGDLKLDNQFTITCTEANWAKELNYLQTFLESDYKLKLKIVSANQTAKNQISIIKDIDMAKESYQLTIKKEGIEITAADDDGLFYALQSLIQIFNANKSKTAVLPYMTIKDQPQYSWRGMHLDCSRHFFTKAEVMRYIDFLALYKFNVFHWHLVDDQGWRIEIKKYPLLTDIGAYRKQTLIGKPTFDKNGKPSQTDQYDGKYYGGYYTQADIKEIVAYAKTKHIEVLPEIEMPGHSLAALSAYPQFSCNGGPFETFTRWGVSDDVYCAGNDATFSFLQDILAEVMPLFPNQYIHIGGDECLKDRWKACPKCQKRMKDENLKNEEALQSYFITRIEKYVNANGKQIIGWDEILEGGLAPNAAVMSWRGTEGGIAASKQKHNVVMSPGKPCYFDHYQSKDRTKEPLAIGGYNPLDAVYAFDPMPEGLTVDVKKYILGAQANVWTEYITNFSQVEYMSMPRMAALSEALWLPKEKKDYTSFKTRLKLHLPYLDKLGVNYAKHFLSEK